MSGAKGSSHVLYTKEEPHVVHPEDDDVDDTDDTESEHFFEPREPPASNRSTRSRTYGCCIAKEYFSDYVNLVQNLQITPRLMIHKAPFRRNSTYGLTLNIRNNGLFPRKIQITTDSPSDTTISIQKAEINRYIETDKELNVKIYIRSSTSININRRRYIFIHSFHPNITFQVPILVVKGLTEPCFSESITLPSTVPQDKSYYEMIIYNPTKEPVYVKYRNSFKGLKLIDLHKTIIAPLDYVKLFIKFFPNKLQEYRGFFNIKCGVSPSKHVIFDYTPKSIGAYVSAGYLSYGLCKFGEEVKRIITICNEAPHMLNVSSEMFSEKDIKNKSPSVDSSLSEHSKISDKLIEEAISMHSVLLFDFDDDGNNENVAFNASAAQHFQFETPKMLEPLKSYQIMLTFRPVFDEKAPFPDDTDPPYLQYTKLSFCFTDDHECIESHYVVVDGHIGGIDVEIFPKTIDMRRVYVGEEHCAFVKILNVDAVVAKVNFKECVEQETCGLRVTPLDGYSLQPCERGIFHVSFYSIVPSRFLVTLRFKVLNGSYYNVHIKGVGQHIQLRTFPQLVEFGSIPFAVPQKRFMLLMNPLAVPITLQITCIDNGDEQPLVFNIRDSSDLLPITIKDPIQHLQAAHEEMRKEHVPEEFNENEFTNDLAEMISMESVSINGSEYSVDFQEDVLEPLNEMASHVLQQMKKQKIFDKTETDKRVIHEALTSLLDTQYFSTMKKHNNFIFLDWNAIPSDPKEVYHDSEIIYLRPNTGRSITILLIPNRVGFYHRALQVRICPAMPNASSESSDVSQVKSMINSEFLCSKLWYDYNCCTPEINWDNIVDLTDNIIYAGEEYAFDMDFFNKSNVGGFIHFDVIPNEMSFFDGTWKFFIGTSSVAVAKCLVAFRELGTNKLSGLLRIVGDPHPYPFHILANVLPTEINITPKSVRLRLLVYELNKLHFYIDNVSPTNTMLSMKLIENEFQYLTVSGGKLAPSGQSMYTTLVSMFTDPGTYLNTLIIDLQFDNVIKVPIVCIVDGVPLYFEPNIKENFDAGLLFTDTKENFNANIFRYSFPVRVINKGLRDYRLNITRLNTYNSGIKASLCANQPLTARFDMIPKLLVIPSNGEEKLEILVTSYEEGVYLCDFLVVVTDLSNPQCKHIIRMTAKATFKECHLYWDRKKLLFTFEPKDPLKERPQMRIAQLINPYNLPIENVLLDVSGPFRIKELYEHHFEKQISIRLNPLEQKEIFVILNKSTMKQIACKQLEGRVNVTAMSTAQKYLNLQLSVKVPEVIIMQPELVLFDTGYPYSMNVVIANQGCTTADFKWRRIEESQIYVGSDNPADAVVEVLSEILRKLEYNFSCADEANLTLRYQQCRCQFHSEHETGSIVLDIIDEIINDLDLAHRRFFINMNDVPESLMDSDFHSSESYIHHTIEYILNRLNIESSQQLSEPSSEYCFSDRYIYFYEKTGQVEELKNQDCLLHLPHVRRFHEVKSTFELDVIGGRSHLLNVTLVNLVQKVQYNNDNIYLNIKPWYETFNTVVRVTNVTKYPLELFIDGPVNKETRLIDGYAKLMQSNVLFLAPLSTGKIKVAGVLGFNENFSRVFNVVINSSAYSYFRLRGQGILPILNITTSLPKVEQSMSDIIEEYYFMRKIYSYEIFKSITEVELEPGAGGEEEGAVEKVDEVTSDFSELSSSEEDMPSERQRIHDIHVYKMTKTYVLVNNNQELPNAVVLNQMLVTERYLRKLRNNPDLYSTHEKVYQSYVDQTKSQPYKLPVQVKHFTVQPLPCEQLGYVLDLGPLTRDTLRRFELRLHFFGPGKLIAAARTAVRIPGLFVDFKVEQHPEKKFTYWAEKCTEPEFFNKSYRNMWERLHDADTEPRLKHAHSFDLDDLIKHQREITDVDRRLIEEYYNSLNYSVYPDHKHHFTLAKIYTSHHSNFSDVELRLVGLFKPQSKYYETDQRIVDYIYIDLHMGPTLPILLRGVIKA